MKCNLHRMLPISVQNHAQNITLMDDNGRSHCARIITSLLQQQRIDRLDPWPACSPDLNPIHNCSDQLGRAVRERVQHGDTLQNLRRCLNWVEVWAACWPRIQSVYLSLLDESVYNCGTMMSGIIIHERDALCMVLNADLTNSVQITFHPTPILGPIT